MIDKRCEFRIVPDDRPERDEIIEKDEIISMIIDLETMSPEVFFNSYFSMHINKR